MDANDAGSGISIIKRTGERLATLDEKLLESGSIFVSGPFTAALSYEFANRLLYLNAVDGQRPVTVYVNSPGGAVHEGLGMIDLCRRVSNPIVTVGWGLCASMGALFLATAAARGSRYLLPNTEVMVHQPLGGAEGQATDIALAARHILGLKQRLTEMLVEATGQPRERVARAVERDHWLTAAQAVEFGLADRVLEPGAKPGLEALGAA